MNGTWTNTEIATATQYHRCLCCFQVALIANIRTPKDIQAPIPRSGIPSARNGTNTTNAHKMARRVNFPSGVSCGFTSSDGLTITPHSCRSLLLENRRISPQRHSQRSRLQGAPYQDLPPVSQLRWMLRRLGRQGYLPQFPDHFYTRRRLELTERSLRFEPQRLSRQH
jgi:hypothetical protein